MKIVGFVVAGFLAGTLYAQDSTPSPSPSASPAPSATATPPPASAKSAAASPTPGDPINGLKDEEIAKALQEIKANFLDHKQTDDKALERATLEGLVKRLSPGAAIVSPAPKPADKDETAFVAEILDSHIGYLRAGALTKDRLTELDAALSGFAPKNIDAVILDLRGMAPSQDFETAADFARKFCAKGKLLYSLQKPSAKQERIFTSNQDPAFQGVLIVLTDPATAGAAEALAATLRLNADAMIIGAQTRGEAVEFSETPLTGGAMLRLAVAQIILPDSKTIFPDGVKPDVNIVLPHDVQAQIFRESKEKGVSQFVFDTERRHMNEASLVANTNPEIDSAQAAQRDRGRTPQPRDTVLQRAVDLVTAIDFYKSKRQ